MNIHANENMFTPHGYAPIL